MFPFPLLSLLQEKDHVLTKVKESMHLPVLSAEESRL